MTYGVTELIHISEKLPEEIKAEAEKAYPNECCGFILGDILNGEKYAERISACKNSSAENEQYHRFVIMPEEMMKAEQLARQCGKYIVGFYHSHPDCAAVPSEYDTTNAFPIYSYIIVSVVNGVAAEALSWELDSDTDYKNFKSETMISEKER